MRLVYTEICEQEEEDVEGEAERKLKGEVQPARLAYIERCADLGLAPSSVFAVLHESTFDLKHYDLGNAGMMALAEGLKVLCCESPSHVPSLTLRSHHWMLVTRW